ncbi:hypothetical protein EJ03DRAFT_334795 [Teratosphaeria nubilosa]|uniref:Uncharacterized protein n=1 Tax=Teratosphaeria nubilosa TaxID=161662 RepID=A0A6G1LFX7_9PEZI|nr:hypothetical protein EJ03DRAFT_334795 [Teratosphaeria nubilosa]
MDILSGSNVGAQDEYDLPYEMLNDIFFHDSIAYGLKESINQDTAMPDLPSDQQDFSSDALPSSIYDYYPGDMPYGMSDQIPSSSTPPTSPDEAPEVPAAPHVANNETGSQCASSSPSRHGRFKLEIVDGLAHVKVEHHYATQSSCISPTPAPVSHGQDSFARNENYETDRGTSALRNGLQYHAECEEGRATVKGSGQQDFGAKAKRAWRSDARVRHITRQNACGFDIDEPSPQKLPFAMDEINKIEEAYGGRYTADLLTAYQIKHFPYPSSWPILLHSSSLKANYIDEQGYPGLPKEQDLYALGSGVHQGLPYTFVPKDIGDLRKEDLAAKDVGYFYIMKIHFTSEGESLDFIIRIGTAEDIGPVKRVFPKPGQDAHFPSMQPANQDASNMNDDSEYERSIPGGQERAEDGHIEGILDQTNQPEAQGEIDHEGEGEDEEMEYDSEGESIPIDEEERDAANNDTTVTNSSNNATPAQLIAVASAPSKPQIAGPATTASAPAVQNQSASVMVHLDCPYPRCARPRVTRSKNRRTDIVTHMVNAHGLVIPQHLRTRGGHAHHRRQRVDQQNGVIRAFFAARNLTPTNNVLY